ncbi:hypothetical protein L228DRAFT_93211 [Xylona heveae TC161]|uniref:Uncharacterized protein n=1 Tax=Xylona heveae (strain CBS 132557 / TC161) TaxID=1328760 RepID=A0A161TEB8_XYLHT|nr:hypothetical protein L228DRAFT_93211 [Xylona heveae TC161]KZF24277.1 hypothetical protein L228DRAFT_93211 [Xylona heveae TC161]
MTFTVTVTIDMQRCKKSLRRAVELGSAVLLSFFPSLIFFLLLFFFSFSLYPPITRQHFQRPRVSETVTCHALLDSLSSWTTTFIRTCSCFHRCLRYGTCETPHM